MNNTIVIWVFEAKQIINLNWKVIIEMSITSSNQYKMNCATKI